MNIYVDKMPKSCGRCPCNDDCYRCGLSGDLFGVHDIDIGRMKNCKLKQLADVRDDATAHKVVGGGERDGATCWLECGNCGLAVDIGDVFCKHCGARFVP